MKPYLPLLALAGCAIFAQPAAAQSFSIVIGSDPYPQYQSVRRGCRSSGNDYVRESYRGGWPATQVQTYQPYHHSRTQNAYRQGYRDGYSDGINGGTVYYRGVSPIVISPPYTYQVPRGCTTSTVRVYR